MGYDLHITRAEHWCDNDGQWITSEEWIELVANDPELRLDEDNAPYCAIWNGPSEHEEPWFDWSDGNIFTKNPDGPMIDKMVEIADKLGANVRGDDGERYAGGERPQEKLQLNWWQRLLGW